MKRRTFLMTGAAAALATRPALAQETEEGALPEVMELVLGNPDAEVEVIEYASFTCPHCATFHAGPFKELKENYIDTGKIRFVYREVYFDRPGLWASMIARCPDDTGFFFRMAEALYATQREWLASGDPAIIIGELRKMAKTAGLDDAMLDECLSDAPKAEALYTWYQENAERDGITGTPSFMIDGEMNKNMSWDAFAAILDEKLGA